MVNSILFIATTFFINRLVFFLSPVALLVILGYSFTKRFTVLCHFVLGLGLSLAPIGAYLAVTGKWALLPVFYSLIVLFWVAGFDIIYSLQDEEFDKDEALRSIPAVLGAKKARIVSFILHLGVTLLVLKTVLVQQTGLLLWIGAIIFIGLLIFQHIALRQSNNNRIDFLFATINGFASLLFAILNILSLYFPNLLIN
jgi:4-hydroxybenzoate polyprenyltransferase